MIWQLDDYKDNIAVIGEDGEEFTYAQFSSYCQELYSSIGKRCLILNFCTNSVGSLVGYISFLNNKVVPIMISAEMDRLLIDNFINIYKPDYLYLPENKVNSFSDYEVAYSNLGYSLLKSQFLDAFPLHDDLALLLTTSGSTGSPKLVRQSYDNIKANTDSIVEYLALDESERAITTLPMSYTYGISILNTHLAVGASLILTDKGIMQKDFWRQLKDYQATSFGGVPYTYEMLNRLRFFKMKLPALRYMTQAGGKLSPELHQKFAQYAEDTDKKFIVMYGQTEATARMSYLPAKESLRKYGSMGIPIPGGKFSLIDIDGEIISTPDTVGELVYIGANVTLGYAEHGEELGLGDERNSKLVTGDMAKFDSDGYYYIVGRKKRFLKIFGNRVNLDETERLIKSNFNIIECACAGVDDKMSIYVLESTKTKEIIDYVSKITGLNHMAFQIVVVDEIPKNESGKTLYKELENIRAPN